jgi:AcrR family transcriptional regulator
MPPTGATKSPWRAATNRTAEREEKRSAVLHAAAAAFAASGYHGTSLDDIAARLGVSKPTVYYYGRSKDELATAVCDRAVEAILEAVEGDTQASSIAQLQHLLRRYAEVMTSDFGRCIPMIRDVHIVGLDESLRERMARIDRRMRQLITQGMEDGSIARCDAKLTAFMIAGAINEIGRWYDPTGPLSPQLIAEKFTNQLTAGLAPR